MKSITILKALFVAAGGWLGYLIGEFNGFLYALIAFIIIDYMTGVIGAIINKNLSSEIGARGILKKVLIVMMVAIGHIIDGYVFQKGSTVRTAIIFFYLSNEGISILENVLKAGLPVPKKLEKILDILNKDD